MYAYTFTRAGKKPFNPVLGETYECERPDKGFHFIAEQVQHARAHPHRFGFFFSPHVSTQLLHTALVNFAGKPPPSGVGMPLRIQKLHTLAG